METQQQATISTNGFCSLQTLLKRCLLAIYFFSNALASQPVITSFSPSKGSIGDTVSIYGNNFSPTAQENIVYFGGIKAAVFSATSSALQVTVPAGATYNQISVTANNLTTISNTAFAVTFENGSITPGTFASLQFFPTKDHTRTRIVSVADMDDDGRIDAITFANSNIGGNRFGDLSIMKNNSSTEDIMLEPVLLYTIDIDFDPAAPSIADLDGDGKPDITIGNTLLADNPAINTFTVLRNTSSPGNISLEARKDFKLPSYGAITVVDFDGDKKPDVMYYSEVLGALLFFKNTSTVGNISFADPISFSLPGYDSVIFGDFNNDDKQDLVLYDYGTRRLNFAKNTTSNGNVSFATPTSFGGQRGLINSVTIGDVGGNGKIDVIVSYQDKNLITIFTNQSTTNTIKFRPWHFINRIMYNLGLADINGDGKPDLLGVTFIDRYNVLTVLKNITASSLSFASPVNYYIDTNSENYAVTDFNKDGKPDIAVGISFITPALSVFRNQTASSINKPLVKSFAPYAGGHNDTIRISGANLTGATKVRFGRVEAKSFTLESDTLITAILDSGASGMVSVTTNKGTSAVPDFIYSNGPTIKISTADTLVCEGSLVKIEAVTTRRAPKLYYVWYKNGKEVGERNKPYITTKLSDGDSVWSVAFNEKQQAKSNVLVFKVDKVLKTVVNVSSSKTTICKGDVVSFKATVVNGGVSPSFKWTINNVPVGTNSDTYTTTGLNNGDSVNCVVRVAEKCAITPVNSKFIKMTVDYGKPANTRAIFGPSVVAAGQSNLAFKVGEVSRARSYQWVVPIDATITSGYNTSTINVTWGSSSGIISLKTMNACGSSDAVTKIVSIANTSSRALTNGAESNIKEVPAFTIYPNPAQTKITVALNNNGNDDNYSIQLMDARGRLLHVEKAAIRKGGSRTEIDVSMYSSGVYHVIIMKNNRIIASKQLLLR